MGLPYRYDRNLIFVGQDFASFLFQEEGFAGLKSKRGNSHPGASFKGLGPNARNIEPPIVVFLGDFDRHGSAALPSQLATARERPVGALKRLYREHGAFFDHHGLPDLKPGNFLGYTEAEINVVPLLGAKFWT